MRRIVIIVLTLLGAGLTPTLASAGTPTLVLTDPATGALLSRGQPHFAGQISGFQRGAQVTLKLYRGTGASGNPVQMLAAGVAGHTFAANAFALADGTYTVQATAQDASGDRGASAVVTFELFNGQPQLTLSAPPAPIATAEPTFSGSAPTDAGDSPSAYLVIYAAPSTDATPLAVLAGSIGPDGSFSIPVQTPLPAGTYTAVVSQPLPGGASFSPAVAFSIPSTAAGVMPSGAADRLSGVVSAITISAAGRLNARVSCPGGGPNCQGDVLIVTRGAFTPSPGGPRGPLALLFSRFDVIPGDSASLTGQLTPGQLRSLRHAGPLRLRVTLATSVGGHLTESTHTIAAVTIA